MRHAEEKTTEKYTSTPKREHIAKCGNCGDGKRWQAPNVMCALPSDTYEIFMSHTTMSYFS